VAKYIISSGLQGFFSVQCALLQEPCAEQCLHEKSSAMLLDKKKNNAEKLFE
jgi:hypothetical protein